MRLNFSVLAFELGRRMPLAEVRGDSDKSLPLPIIYKAGAPLISDNLYIACGSELPTRMTEGFEGSLIVTGGVSPDIGDEAEHLILLERESEPDDIYNQVREVFQIFEDWDEKLLAICERAGTIQELLDVSSPVMDNQLIVTDENSNVLAGSYKGRHDVSGEYVDIVHSDMTPKNLDAIINQITPTIFTTEFGDYIGGEESFKIMVKGIIDRASGANVSLALRPHTRPVGDYDCWMMEHLAGYILWRLPRMERTKDQAAMEIFASLLNGEVVEQRSLNYLFDACGFYESNRFRCLLTTNSPFVTSLDHNYVWRRFHAIVPNAVVATYDKYIVVLFNETRNEWEKSGIREWFISWLGEHDEPIGISDKFEKLTNLKEFYLEAEAAFIHAKKNKVGIAEFSECLLDFALNNCVGEFKKRRLFPEGIRRLLELNHSASVDYIKTLRVWLDEGMNDNQTAQKLFIRRNSFLYRKERMLDALDMDVQDPEVRFYLSLCLRLVVR